MYFRDVFLAMLSEKIRSTDFNWDDAKSKLKKDSRWNQVADLDRTEMENTFNHHMAKVLESFSGIHLSDFHCFDIIMTFQLIFAHIY